MCVRVVECECANDKLYAGIECVLYGIRHTVNVWKGECNCDGTLCSDKFVEILFKRASERENAKERRKSRTEI